MNGALQLVSLVLLSANLATELLGVSAAVTISRQLDETTTLPERRETTESSVPSTSTSPSRESSSINRDFVLDDDEYQRVLDDLRRQWEASESQSWSQSGLYSTTSEELMELAHLSTNGSPRKAASEREAANARWQALFGPASNRQEEEDGEEPGEPFCSICLTSIKPEERSMIELSCGHSFHRSCLRDWFDSSDSYKHTCPNCRKWHSYGVLTTMASA